MSIYASSFDLDADDHDTDCARWVLCECPDDHAPHTGRISYANDGRHYPYDDTIPCSCGTGPLRYQGSHVLPSEADPHGGTIHASHIPGFITRDGRCLSTDDEDYPVWPYLRVGVGDDEASAMVVLTRARVEELRDYLAGWLTWCVVDSPADLDSASAVTP